VTGDSSPSREVIRRVNSGIFGWVVDVGGVSSVDRDAFEEDVVAVNLFDSPRWGGGVDTASLLGGSACQIKMS
jgi:hypothetical protein